MDHPYSIENDGLGLMTFAQLQQQLMAPYNYAQQQAARAAQYSGASGTISGATRGAAGAGRTTISLPGGGTAYGSASGSLPGSYYGDQAGRIIGADIPANPAGADYGSNAGNAISPNVPGSPPASGGGLSGIFSNPLLLGALAILAIMIFKKGKKK